MIIILDTNAFRIFADKEACNRFVEKVVKKCDRIFVPYSIDKELRGRFYSLLHLFYSTLRRLERGGKFGVAKVKGVDIPERVEEELSGCGASQFDRDVVRLAFKKRRDVVYEETCIASDDKCLQSVKALLENYGIVIKSLKEFEEEYLKEESAKHSLKLV
jgi:hypothetical protein